MQVFLVDVASVQGAVHSSKFVSVNHYPRKFNTPQKKTLTSWAQHKKTLQQTIAFLDRRQIKRPETLIKSQEEL